MTICSRCGAEATSYDRFCKKCGRRLDVRDADFALAEPAPAYVPPGGSGWTDPLAGISGDLASSSGASNSASGTKDTDVSSGTTDASTTDANTMAASVATMTTADASALSMNTSTASAPDMSMADASTVTLTLAAAAASAVARLLVRPISSPTPTEIREYALDGQNVALGRSPSCDIVLEGDPLISRRHALLRYDGTRYTIVDLGSSNGTFVNDDELTEAHALAAGDRIQLGEYELTYATGPASPSASWTGAHNGLRGSGHGPAPKTEPHLNVVSSAGGVQMAEESGSLSVPEPAERTIPKSDLVGAASTAVASAPAAENPVMEAPAASADGVYPAGAGVMATAAMAEDDAPTVTPAPAMVSDLQALRDQIATMMTTAETLARRANEADRQAEQRQAALVEARDRLASLISELRRITSDDGEDLTPLLRIVRQAAENPRHMDYVTQLADSAGDVLSVLQARQARQTAPTETLNALSTLYAWLARVD